MLDFGGAGGVAVSRLLCLQIGGALCVTARWRVAQAHMACKEAVVSNLQQLSP